MPSPALTSDVEARWRTLSLEESGVAGTLLGDAWRTIKKRIPDVEARMADSLTGADYTDAVIQVQAQAVVRVLKNPDGKRSESIDDYSWTRDRAISSGLLTITDDEWELLGIGGLGGAFTIDTAPATAGSPDPLPISVTGIPAHLDWT